jgi:Fe-S-cluster containining protein
VSGTPEPASGSDAPRIGESFVDDVDTVPQCTGACCDPVPLPAEDYWDMSTEPRRYKNARYIMKMLIPPGPGPVPRHGEVDFACRYFDKETRRCIAYDRRPAMCREFPETGTCGHCGGRFAPGTHVKASDADVLTGVEAARLAAMQTLVGMYKEPPPKRHPPRRLHKRGKR